MSQTPTGLLRNRLAAAIALVFMTCFTAALPAAAMGPASSKPGDPKRFALLIGNQAYAPAVGRLRNPGNDVRLVAGSLEQVGFLNSNITIVDDADRVTILRALDSFADKVAAAGPDAIAFFYYSGHGAASQRDKRNYLIPIEVKALDRSVWYQAVSLTDIVAKLSDRAPNAAHFVIFDACRNLLQMPTRGGKGFVPVSAKRGMLIAFSTEPGETASDEGDGAGPYAQALASELVRPGLDHLDLFQNVKEKVFRKTGSQVPWERNGLLRRIYMSGDNHATSSANLAPSNEAQQAWSVVAESEDKGVLEAYIARFKGSFFADLARRRLASLQGAGKTASLSGTTGSGSTSDQVGAAAGAGSSVFRREAGGKIILTAPKWRNAKGFRQVSKKEAEARLAGYTVVYGNGSREYHAPDGQTKIWRKRRNAYSYGKWSVNSAGRLSYRYGRRQGCWGYILYNAETQKFRVDWRKAICKYGFARFIEGEDIR